MSRALRLGIAIGDDIVAASWPLAGGEMARWSAPRADRALDDLFAELRARLPVHDQVRVALSLLPPLVKARRVELPPMSVGDRAAVISRVAARYFVGLDGEILTGIAAGRSLTFAADKSVIDELARAIATMGWTVDRIVPSQSAWWAAATERWPQLRSATSDVGVAGSSDWTTLGATNGRLELVRRTRAPLPPVAGHSSQTLSSSAEESALLAAAFAWSAEEFELSSEEQRSAERHNQRRVAGWLLAAAAGFLLVAAGMHRYGLQRQLDVITAMRRDLRPRVAAAMAQRDSLAHLDATVRTIAGLEARSPRWTALIGRVADALPHDASLTSMRADGDSLSLDGEATNAATVFSALNGAPGILSLRPAAPIRQETTPGAPPIERWMITTRIDHRAAVRGGHGGGSR